MSELELKFGVPEAVQASLRDTLLAHGAKRTRLQAHYFDTADGLLAHHRMALRLRLEGHRWVQTLKAAGDGIVHRLEHEVGVAGPGRVVPALDRHRHDGSQAGKRLDALLLAVPDAELAERHATDIERLHCLLRDTAGTQIEVAFDSGSASAGDRSEPITELELEHKGGPVQGLFDLAAAWQAHGGLWLCSITKAQRGERLLQRDAVPVALKARAPRIDAGADGPALLQAFLQSAMEQVLVNASEVAEGATASDTIHQLRIGLRRLRTVLRELAMLSPAIVPEWDRALSVTFAQLGQTRDQEAVVAAVRPLLAAAGAPLMAWHAAPAPEPATAVREPGFQATLIAILALAHAGPDRFAPLTREAARGLVAARLDKLHRQITRAGRNFEQLALPEQHRARKRLKRLRYLAEMTAALWPRAALRRFLKGLTVAQEALGWHNDVAVAAAAFRDDAAVHPEAWFAAGYLQAQQPQTARAARKALLKMAAAGKCWA